MKIKRKYIQEVMQKGHSELRLLWYWIQVGKVMAPAGGLMKKPDIIKGLIDRGIKKSTAYLAVSKLIERGILIPRKHKKELHYYLISHKRFAPERLYGRQKIKLNEEKINTYSGFLDELATKLALKLQAFFDRRKVRGILRLRNLSEWYGVSRSWWSRHLRNEPKELIWAWKQEVGKGMMMWLKAQALREGYFLKIEKIAPFLYYIGEIEGFRLIPNVDANPYADAYS